MIIHVTFLDADGHIIGYHKGDPSNFIPIPAGAITVLANASEGEE